MNIIKIHLVMAVSLQEGQWGQKPPWIGKELVYQEPEINEERGNKVMISQQLSHFKFMRVLEVFWMSSLFIDFFKLNPNGALFLEGYFSQKKCVWRSKISWLFLIHYELSENQMNFFWFFMVILGDLEGACTMHNVPLALKLYSKAPHY